MKEVVIYCFGEVDLSDFMIIDSYESKMVKILTFKSNEELDQFFRDNPNVRYMSRRTIKANN